MSLSSISIRRPVLATVMSILIVLFGAIGLLSLGVREFPSVDPPVITVTTEYTGANADIIETQITEPIEESVNRIEGIRTLTSVSIDGKSTVTVEFDLDVDLEAAANDVRDKVSQAVRSLPPDAEPPSVTKADASSFPIIFLNIKSSQRNLMELTEIAETTFKERFQTISGVSDVQVWGAKRYSMRLWMDPDKLAAYQLTPLDVRNALNRENIELPSGSIEGESTELTVRTQGRLSTPEEFNDLIVKDMGGSKVYFRDLGYAELGPQNLRTVLKRDGVPMVGNAIVARPGSNNIDIADEFYRRLEQIEKDLPADISTEIGFDTTKFVRASIREVQQTILIAFILVVFIIFFFLRDWRTTIIPVVVIPISLVGAFFILFVAGYTINVLSMLGLVLAIGLVVDDAVVVLENIYAKIEQGMNPREAALKGSAEIFFAVIATTVSLVAVFMPIIFLEGLTGRLFREFGVTIAGAVVISSFVALTLTPMLSGSILKRREKHHWFYNATEAFFVSLTQGYRGLLEDFMRFRWVALLIVVASVGLIYVLGNNLPSELAPLEDRNRLRVTVSGQEGATFEYMDEYLNEMVEVIEEKVPEAEGIISITSPSYRANTSVNSGFALVNLSDPEARERSQQEIADVLTEEVGKLTGAKSFVTQSPTIGSRFGLPVEFVVQAADFEDLKEAVPAFLQEAYQDPTFTFVDVNLKFNRPEVKISINREKARSMGVATEDIAQTLQLGLSGQRFGYYIMRGKQYWVIGQVDRPHRNDPFDLRNLTVRNRAGDMVQLDNLVSLEEVVAPPQRYRYNRYKSATFSAGLVEGKTVQDGIRAMEAIAERVLDDRYTTSLDGNAKEFAESSSSLVFAFLLALVLVYLVLAAQFESYRDPLTIMFTVPLALAGALLFLWYFHQTLNIFSQIGIIMLIGLVSKNGILMVEFANQQKARGMKKLDAIMEAATARFRPILMTSLSTILGVLPIALALGAGSESRVSMGIAVIGGMSFATVLTLLVIPAMYVFISEKDKSVSNLDAAADAPIQPAESLQDEPLQDEPLQDEKVR